MTCQGLRIAALSAVLAAGSEAPLLAAGSDGRSLAATLRAAGNLLESPSPAADPAKPLTEILGVLVQAADGTGLPGRQRDRLREAHARLKKDGWAAEPAARAAMEEAYATVNGRAFRFPAAISTIEQAREACRRELERAVSALEKDRPSDAVKPILELLLLAGTPLEGH
jgi:hypothetical protein